ncbi:MAG: DUF305 domain-containing protein [bacterium]|nr:DUF305 domain-containing protein [bacterium]
MTNDQLKYGVGGLLIGGIAVWLILASTGNFNSRGMMNQRFASENQMTNSGMLDAHFIEQMIPHHEDAITMAKLALEKAQHPEIKQLSQSIIDSQSKEINQMKTWYKEWFGREVPTGTQVMGQHGMMGGRGMHMGMMGNESDIQRLEQAANFDRVFIEEMIPHHQMAVMMASMLKNGTQRAEMRQLTDDIIAAQTREIVQMRQWYDAWF